jgi:hypothetical protein
VSPTGARDNKSVAETSETHPSHAALGALCAVGGMDSGLAGSGTLTRPANKTRERGVRTAQKTLITSGAVRPADKAGSSESKASWVCPPAHPKPVS